MSTAAEGTSAPRATDTSAHADIEPLLSGNAPEAPDAQTPAPQAEASKSSIWGWLRWPRAATASQSSPDEEAPAIAESQSSGASIPVIAEGARPSGGGSEIEAAQLGGSPRGGARPQPVCLICLEPLTSDDFQTGRAMSLDCHCRGELALRHKECAIKWARVKGDTTCELCKHPVGNLPALPPRPPLPAAEPGAADEAYDPQYLMEFAPTYADLLFDCVRVCWVAMIVGILFFELTLDAALWTGVVAGLAYCCMVKLMYRQHFAAMHRLQQQQAQALAGSPAAPPVVVAV